ncbi:MAG TPA: hypothetical protein VIC71_09655 [Gammaproteobacteria bacterium]|jgi:hypothetical protein
MAAISLCDAATTVDDGGCLTQVEAHFAQQIAMAVWLSKLSDEAARDTLGLYALAGRRGKPAQAGLRAALVAEYCQCRERLDFCS